MKHRSTGKNRAGREFRRLDKIFSEKWIQKMRNALEQMEQNDLDKTDKTFSKAAKMLVTYRCMGDLTLEYSTPESLSRIIRATETVCNRMGVSLRDKAQVEECLTKKHDECKRAYSIPSWTAR